MKNLNFHYLAAENFRCFGPKGIQLDLTKYGNIVLIRGDNLDVEDEEERVSSNGCGKSSIPDLIPYTLFGKTVRKKLTHKNLINNQTGKKLRTEVQWDDFRVVRTRRPDTLRIWESENKVWNDNSEITLGGMPATQKLIEDKIGLNYETFRAIMIFTDDNSGSFLECDAATKREIVENLLSLERYRQYCDSAKKIRNEFKQNLILLTKEYEFTQRMVVDSEQRISSLNQQENDWRIKKQQELKELILKYKEKQSELVSTDQGAAINLYNEAQNETKILNDSMLALRENQERIQKVIVEAQEKLDVVRAKRHQLVMDGQQHKHTIDTNRKYTQECNEKIASLEGKDGTECPTCYGQVKKENFKSIILHANNRIDNLQGSISKTIELLDKCKNDIGVQDGNINKLNQGIEVANEKYAEITEKLVAVRNRLIQLSGIKKPEASVDEAVIQAQMESLKKLVIEKEDESKGSSPFLDQLATVKTELKEKQLEFNAKKTALDKADSLLPYYEFWVKAFGDTGIRKFVIDGVIPALNSRIAYWLQFLIDGKIQLEFDNQLEEIIERNPSDGDPFVYHAMSGGERRRLNLAVSQAFAHVMVLSSGMCPSLVFLDEVTTNIDPIGVVGVYNMISELAKERQVFVTTHDQDLLEMLTGCETIGLEKRGGFTRVV